MAGNMKNRKELYSDKVNFRAAQIDAAMNGRKQPTRAEWNKQQAAKKKKS